MSSGKHARQQWRAPPPAFLPAVTTAVENLCGQKVLRGHIGSRWAWEAMVIATEHDNNLDGYDSCDFMRRRP